MTALNMKTEAEKIKAQEAWVEQLMSLPGHEACDYEKSVTWIVGLYYQHKLHRYQGRIFCLTSKAGVNSGSFLAEITIPKSSWSDGLIYDSYKHYEEYNGATTQAIKELKHKTVLMAFFVFMTANFDTEITPKMFSLLCEHIEADIEHFLSIIVDEGFATCMADYWKLADNPCGYSSGIHDATTRGYGAIDNNGFWMFPLPDCPDHAVVTPPEPKEAGPDAQF